jgi:hypothetical protein
MLICRYQTNNFIIYHRWLVYEIMCCAINVEYNILFLRLTITCFEFGWRRITHYLSILFILLFFLFHFLFMAAVQGFFWRFLFLTNTGNPVILFARSLDLPATIPRFKFEGNFRAVVENSFRKSYRWRHRMRCAPYMTTSGRL